MSNVTIHHTQSFAFSLASRICMPLLDGSRNKEVTLTRLRLGKCWVNEYLARIKAVYSDRCSLCKKSSETVEHFILLCPSSDLCKKVLSVCRQINVLPEIGQVLSNKNVLDETYVNLSRKI